MCVIYAHKVKAKNELNISVTVIAQLYLDQPRCCSIHNEPGGDLNRRPPQIIRILTLRQRWYIDTKITKHIRPFITFSDASGKYHMQRSDERDKKGGHSAHLEDKVDLS